MLNPQPTPSSSSARLTRRQGVEATLRQHTRAIPSSLRAGPWHALPLGTALYVSSYENFRVPAFYRHSVEQAHGLGDILDFCPLRRASDDKYSCFAGCSEARRG